MTDFGDKIPYKRVDLHVHSLYSDGTLTPAELLALAEQRGVGLLAIADHDVTAGSEELCGLAAGSPVKCVPAVELTAFDYKNPDAPAAETATFDYGSCVHILAYGYDFGDADFAAFTAENRRRLDDMSDRLIEAMERMGEPVSVREYAAFEHDRRGGGWKALHYLKKKGLTDSLIDGARLYPKFGVGYNTAGFKTVAEVCEVVRRAGAVSVLAHPGVTFQTNDAGAFTVRLRELAEQGIAGIECYYPEHNAETVVICREVCDDLGLLVTCGTDCHGGFTGAELGSLPVTVDQIRISTLLS